MQMSMGVSLACLLLRKSFCILPSAARAQGKHRVQGTPQLQRCVGIQTLCMLPLEDQAQATCRY